jgi:hypothetical protein
VNGWTITAMDMALHTAASRPAFSAAFFRGYFGV